MFPEELWVPIFYILMPWRDQECYEQVSKQMNGVAARGLDFYPRAGRQRF